MSRVEVLMSCMHQKDDEIISSTNINTDVIVINQCDENKTELIKREFGTVRIFFTTQRGVSKSRNMALDKSSGEFCLLCDDDEILTDGYKDIIIDSFANNPDTDIIIFNADIPRGEYWSKEKKMGYIKALKIGNWQICFKRESIIKNGICFDEFIGSGTGNGGGEENKFMFDCIKKGLKIKYIPTVIAKVGQTQSQWFYGFDEKYFYERGISTTHIMGHFFATVYSFYYALTKYKKYKKSISFLKAIKSMWKGITSHNSLFSKFMEGIAE